MIHLHWSWENPKNAKLDIVTSGRSVCSANHDRDHLTLNPEEVTCQVCLASLAVTGELIETKEAEMPQTDLDKMTNPQLTAMYNAMAGKTGVVMPVKKFKDLETARRRVAKLMAQVPPKDEARPKLKVVKADSGRISNDARITLIDSVNTSRGKTRPRFDEFVAKAADIKTVADYLAKVKGARKSDIPWWRDRGKIEIS